MATIPKKAQMNATAADVVNSVASEAGLSNVPRVLNEGETLADGSKATKAQALQSLRAAGEAISGFQPNANAFLSALVNRIGLVIINSKLYSNPWAMFKKGMMEYGESIEELFVNIVSAQQFDPETAENEVFKRKLPDVRSAFHTMNYQKFYKTTVSQEQLRQAFLSFQGISDLVGRITEALYTSENYDEFLVMKYMLAQAALKGQFYPVAVEQATPANSNAIVTTLKTMSDNLTFLKSDYNVAGVHTFTDKNNQVFIMSTAFANMVDVETLALAFNIDKVELMGRIVRVDSFGFDASEIARLDALLAANPGYETIQSADNTKLKAIPCICVDASFFMIFDNFQQMTDAYNGQGLYWNYFLHAWKTFSTSPFANALLFSTETPAVTAVAVTPETATASPGALLYFNAKVTNAGFAPAGVEWSISGNSSGNTTIDQQGRLKLAADEAGPTITVTAKSKYTPTATDTATVTVQAG